MHINIYTIKQQLAQRKMIPTLKSNIGSAIKYYRRKQDMTLEEGADGICSVSYLSKVENNIIVPNEKYVQQLKERFSIIEDENYDYKKAILQMIDHHFYQNDDIENNVDKQKDAKSILLRLSYYILKNQFVRAYEEYAESLPFIKNYDNTEIVLYLYCVSNLFVHQGLLDDALTILTQIEDIEISEYKLKLLVQFQKVMVALDLNHYPYLMTHYENMKEKILNKGAYHLVRLLKKKYYAYLALSKEVSDEIIQEENDLIKEKEYLVYLKSLNYYRKGDYQSAYDAIEAFIEFNESYAVLAVKSLSRLGDKALLSRILGKTHLITAKDYLQLFGYIRIKMNNLDSAIQYLKDEIIKNKIFFDRYETLIFYYEEISSLFRMKSYYKEMSQFNQKMIKKVLLRHGYLK